MPLGGRVYKRINGYRPAYNCDDIHRLGYERWAVVSTKSRALLVFVICISVPQPGVIDHHRHACVRQLTRHLLPFSATCQIIPTCPPYCHRGSRMDNHGHRRSSMSTYGYSEVDGCSSLYLNSALNILGRIPVTLYYKEISSTISIC